MGAGWGDCLWERGGEGGFIARRRAERSTQVVGALLSGFSQGRWIIDSFSIAITLSWGPYPKTCRGFLRPVCASRVRGSPRSLSRTAGSRRRRCVSTPNTGDHRHVCGRQRWCCQWRRCQGVASAVPYWRSWVAIDDCLWYWEQLPSDSDCEKFRASSPYPPAPIRPCRHPSRLWREVWKPPSLLAGYGG
jgi:hypothetical protein